MKKHPVALASVIIFGILVVGRLTKVWQFYSIPTGAMHPTIKVGDHALASNLIVPKTGDLLCFYCDFGFFGKEQPAVYVQRICGSEGDRLEMINGKLFINGKEFNKGLDLAYKYAAANKKVSEIISLKIATEVEMMMVPYGRDSSLISLPSSDACNIDGIRRFFYPNQNNMSELFNSHQWTLDNFGPLMVPEGHWFTMGDNRNNSYDSRYFGFVPRSKYEGIVFSHF